MSGGRWGLLLIAVFVAGLAGNMIGGFFLQRMERTKPESIISKNDYIKLAEAQIYLLNSLMKDGANLQKYMPAYKGMTPDEFREATRRKLVRLQMEVDYLKKGKIISREFGTNK